MSAIQLDVFAERNKFMDCGEIIKLLYDVFFFGCDYGLLKAEEERDMEDWGDAFQGYIIDCKYGMPSQIAPRRQPHSDKWREAKRESYRQFKQLITNILNGDG
jgi:hypothetical protein